MSYQSKCADILNLFTFLGKEVPHEDSDMGRAVQILQTICDTQSHSSIPVPAEYTNDPDGAKEDVESDSQWVFEALEELETMISDSEDDYRFDFDGHEYRLIKESEIWDIYVEEIKQTVEDCYELNLDKIPAFIAVSVNWEQTAKNAYADGYGHQFSGYDGSEEDAAGYYIFRTN